MAVRRHLPPDNEMNRRNKKYRILYDAFDTIDGKPIRTNEYYDKVNKLFFFIRIKVLKKLNSFNFHFKLNDNPNTPRFTRNIRTPSKSKTNIRATSLDRKTPMSMADESEYSADK